MNNKAFTLVEIMMAVTFTTFLMIGIYSFYNAASQTYSSGMSSQTFQDGANIVISKIIEGEMESGTIYRLSTSNTYTIADGSATAFSNSKYKCTGGPQTAPCNALNTASELYFCQDDPFNNTPSSNCNFNDNTARWYYLNSSGTSVIYHHPSGAGTVEEKIYTAPQGSTLSLRFSPATTNPSFDVEIDVAVTQNLSQGENNNRVISGAASTVLLLRNHS